MRRLLPPMRRQRGHTLAKSSYLQLMPTLDHGAVCRNAKNRATLSVWPLKLSFNINNRNQDRLSLGRRSSVSDAAEVWPGNLQ
jgi:hypothetical protein